MLFELLLIVILSSAGAEYDEKLWKIAPEDGWNDELRFWSNIACRAGRRRIFSLHEIPKTDQSRRLHDFFGDMITNVQTKCGATTQTKSYRDKDHETYNRTAYTSLFDEENYEEIITKSAIFIEKPDKIARETSIGEITHLFPQRDVEILLVLIDDSVRILMNNGNVFKNWDNGRHVLILMITKKPITSNTSKLLSDTFVILLQRLWHERRVLNVFFAAPFSKFGHLIWFYDPFIVNSSNGRRGKIFARKVSRIPSIDRLTNLHGYRLNIGMFEAQPAAIKYFPKSSYDFPFARESQNFVGIDGLTMETIAKHMNFTYNIVPPTDGLEFGYVHPNGTFMGTIGDAAHHKIDIGFNSMYSKIYTQHEHCTNTIEFTTSIDFDRLCIIVPRARKIPRWLRTFYYFHPAIWLCLVITHIIVALIWYIVRNNIRGFKKKSSKNHQQQKRSTYRSLLLTTFFLFIGSPVNIKASQVERIILASLLIFGVTIMGTFTGTLYHSFTHEMYYKEIGSLKELDDIGIPVGTASPNLKDVFGLQDMADDPEEIRSLRKKFHVMNYDDISTIEKTAYRRNIASLSRENVFAVSRHRYVDESGASLIHLVPECPRTYYLSYVVPKNSVYLKQVNVLITRLLQAGLPPLWNSMTTERLINVESAKAHSPLSNMENVPFNLRDLQTAFILLSIGHGVAICIFIGELSFRKRQDGCRISGRILRGWGSGFCGICEKCKNFRAK